ncbi:TKL family protein kinase [Histomonas meleagridis]|uniref:TKL family protein kinase n=1 Tax=Histomonas meleagridis TaxID=135588 RepID=UPI00355ACC10|nr:TKL family protein kinase [Histomonas meleagridis]KAH0805960.1 TKL family protein kinase [Histomonas meleagridis]
MMIKQQDPLMKYIMNPNSINIGKEMGKGTFGKTFLATNNKYNKIIVKQIFNTDPQQTEQKRYLHDAKLAVSLSSPFIVPVVGFTNAQPYYMATQYMPKNLFSLSKHNKTLTPTQKTMVLLTIAKGLEYLHSKELTYSYFKYSNILFDENMNPKLADCWYSIFLSPKQIKKLLISSNQAAPEVASGGDITKKSDIFAFALLIYELAENVKPFSNIRSSKEYTKKITQGERPKFKKMSPELRKIIHKCWHNNPEFRPSASQIADEVMLYVDSLFPGTDANTVKQFLKSNTNNSETAKTATSNIASKSNEIFSYENHHRKRSKSRRHHSKPDIYVSDVIEPIPLTSEESIIPIILSNCQHQHFISCLQYCENELIPEKVISIIPIFISHFQSDVEEQYIDLLMSAFIRMVQRDAKFIRIFAERSLLSYLPFRGHLLGKTIFLIQYLLYYSPSSISTSHFKMFHILINKCPNEMMPLIHFFSYNSTRIDNIYPFVDILFNCINDYIETIQGTYLLQALLYMYYNNQQFAQARKSNIDEIIPKFFNSSIDGSIKLCYGYFCTINNGLNQLDSNILLKHLTKPNFVNTIVSVLLRRNELMTKEIFAKLVDLLTNENEEDTNDIWNLLCNIASNKIDEDLFLSVPKWIDCCLQNPEKGIVLISYLFKSIKLRQLITTSTKYVDTLNALKIDNDTEKFELVANLAANGRFNQKIVMYFSKSGMLQKITSIADQQSNIELKAKVLVMIEKMACFGFLNEFTTFVNSIIKLLTVKQYLPLAVHSVAMLSVSKEFTAKIAAKNGIMKYFKDLMRYKKYREDATTFLKKAGEITI